jgi:hypothetical protein
VNSDELNKAFNHGPYLKPFQEFKKDGLYPYNNDPDDKEPTKIKKYDLATKKVVTSGAMDYSNLQLRTVLSYIQTELGIIQKQLDGINKQKNQVDAKIKKNEKSIQLLEKLKTLKPTESERLNELKKADVTLKEESVNLANQATVTAAELAKAQAAVPVTFSDTGTTDSPNTTNQNKEKVKYAKNIIKVSPVK